MAFTACRICGKRKLRLIPVGNGLRKVSYEVKDYFVQCILCKSSYHVTKEEWEEYRKVKKCPCGD